MEIKPKILVTGANGQLGQELRDLALLNSTFEFVFFSKEDLSIQHVEELRNCFKKIQPQFCINCAAYTNVDKAEQKKEIAFEINAIAVGLLATVCKEFSTKLIHISTDYVFDGTASIPYKEDTAPNPQSIYGDSKLEGEKLALKINTSTIIIRTSWVYSVYGKNFVKTMLRLMREKTEIAVVNDQVGSPTCATDLAELLLQIIASIHLYPEKKFSGIYNFSNNGVVSWYDFATAIKEISNSTCPLTPIATVEFPTAAIRPAYSVLDKEKIKTVFGIELKDWKKSLQTCIEKINFKLDS